jgi:hypothetical protein
MELGDRLVEGTHAERLADAEGVLRARVEGVAVLHRVVLA